MQDPNHDNRDRLVNAGISFMHTITDIYGAEKGMELWTVIADTIDPDLKGAIFMALLTGNYHQDRIHVKQPFQGPMSSKVSLIKCIRNYDKRNLGLKEAKDIADSLESGVVEVLQVRPEIRPTFVVELRKLGMVI
jgi:hypothetical protein